MCISLPPTVYGVKTVSNARSLHLDGKFTSKVLEQKDAVVDQLGDVAQGVKDQSNDLLSWDVIGKKLDKLAKSPLDGLKLPAVAQRMPDFLDQLWRSFNFEEGSMGSKLVAESKVSAVAADANVRIGPDLCPEETEYLTKRSQFTKAALAKYLDIPEDDIDPADIPIIGIAGSGGGLRACLTTTSYYDHMKQSGLFDTVTYLAAVSGSTWAQTLFMTLGKQDPAIIINHLKKRLTKHIADPAPGIECLMDKVTGPYVLSGIFERCKQGHDDFGLVDLYGIMLSSRLLVPNNQLTVSKEHMRISSQAKVLDRGQNPMPIYSVVQSVVPLKAKKEAQDHNASEEGQVKEMVSKSLFQFYEITPFEFGSEELSAWIPTWAMGRKFQNGVSTTRHAETSLTTLLGTFSSAFCASLSLYWREVKAVLPDTGIFKTINEQLEVRDDELKRIHLVEATRIANYTKGLRQQLPDSMSPELTEQDHIKLCDSGMEQNIPFYPLLRRKCDIIIAIDSSADIDTTPWFENTEGWVKRRGIQAWWPGGAGWPRDQASANKELASADESEEATQAKLADAKKKRKYALDGINIWVGQSTESGSSPEAQRVGEDFESVSSSSGLMLIYLPLLPHERCPDLDPATTDFLSTWNFVYKPEQVDALRDLTKAHFEDGKDRMKRAVRAMYERKRKNRLASSST